MENDGDKLLELDIDIQSAHIDCLEALHSGNELTQTKQNRYITTRKAKNLSGWMELVTYGPFLLSYTEKPEIT